MSVLPAASKWEQDTHTELLDRLSELHWDLAWISEERFHSRLARRSDFAHNSISSEQKRVADYRNLCASPTTAPAVVSLHLDWPPPHRSNFASESTQKSQRFCTESDLLDDPHHSDGNTIIKRIFRDPTLIFFEDSTDIQHLSPEALTRYALEVRRGCSLDSNRLV